MAATARSVQRWVTTLSDRADSTTVSSVWRSTVLWPSFSRHRIMAATSPGSPRSSTSISTRLAATASPPGVPAAGALRPLRDPAAGGLDEGDETV